MSAGSGIGVIGLTGIVFVVLKLCHVIAWSWWWVTAPLWGGYAALLLALTIVFFILALREARASSRR